MELYLIRHGESTANLEMRFSGWSPAELTEKGKKQAERTGERLRGLSFDHIFCSDQLRAKQTADRVFPGLKYTEDQRLRELHLGEKLEGRLRSECLEQYGQAFRDAVAKRDFTPFGGESYAMHRERAGAFLRDLERFPDDAQIAAVCHGGTILAMLSYITHTVIMQNAMILENASITCFRWTDGVWKMIKWGDTGSVICENGPAAKNFAG